MQVDPYCQVKGQSAATPSSLPLRADAADISAKNAAGRFLELRHALLSAAQVEVVV
jgi:hypothetical protein